MQEATMLMTAANMTTTAAVTTTIFQAPDRQRQWQLGVPGMRQKAAEAERSTAVFIRVTNHRSCFLSRLRGHGMLLSSLEGAKGDLTRTATGGSIPHTQTIQESWPCTLWNHSPGRARMQIHGGRNRLEGTVDPRLCQQLHGWLKVREASLSRIPQYKDFLSLR